MLSGPRQTLLNVLDEGLSVEEVKELAFALDLDWHNLGGGETKRGQLRALIEHTQRRQHVQQLVAMVTTRRPDLGPALNALDPAAEPTAGDDPPPSEPRLIHLGSGDDWLDFVIITLCLIAVLKMAQGHMGIDTALLVLASMLGGLRSLGARVSIIWTRGGAPLAWTALVGVPWLLAAALTGYYLLLYRQVVAVAIAIPLALAAGRLVFLLYQRSRAARE